jgi:hypothetical protein
MSLAWDLIFNHFWLSIGAESVGSIFSALKGPSKLDMTEIISMDRAYYGIYDAGLLKFMGKQLSLNFYRVFDILI